MKSPLITPYFVIMNNHFDKSVDRFVNGLLDRQPEIMCSYSEHYVTLKIRDRYISIWIASKWYAYASRGNDSTAQQGNYPGLGKELWDNKRPRRRTMIRLHQYIKGHGAVKRDELSLSTILGEDINNVGISNNK